MRTRFAPSPTGLMHFGNCRTALFNYLLAKKQQGEFILRIEDTDVQRSEHKYILDLCRDLKDLGLQWDLGPYYLSNKKDKEIESKLDNEYFQSNRISIYEDYYNQLIKEDKAYHCFCSETELKIIRKRQLAAGEPPRYSGTCRYLSRLEQEKRILAGDKAALRLKVDNDNEIVFKDKIRGHQRFLAKHLGDFIIRKSDGSASFMFANAVDDAMMRVDLVLRGEDHLTNSPRQILILKALGLEKRLPQYAHISMIVGNDGAPLSKRNGSKSIREMLDEGYLPEALLNYMARLGCKYENNNLLSIDMLFNLFDSNKLARAAAKYDIHQLNHWQGQSLATFDNKKLANWLEKAALVNNKKGRKLKQFLTEYPNSLGESFIATIKHNILLPQDIIPWISAIYNKPEWDNRSISIMKEAGKVFFNMAAKYITEGTDKITEYEIPAEVRHRGCNLEEHITWHSMLNKLVKSSGRERAKLFMPLRLALTGIAKGPSLDDIHILLGKEETSNRFKRAAHLCG